MRNLQNPYSAEERIPPLLTNYFETNSTPPRLLGMRNPFRSVHTARMCKSGMNNAARKIEHPILGEAESLPLLNEEFAKSLFCGGKDSSAPTSSLLLPTQSVFFARGANFRDTEEVRRLARGQGPVVTRLVFEHDGRTPVVERRHAEDQIPRSRSNETIASKYPCADTTGSRSPS